MDGIQLCLEVGKEGCDVVVGCYLPEGSGPLRPPAETKD